MHIPDGFLDSKTTVSLWTVAIMALSFCLNKVKVTFTALAPQEVLAGAKNISTRTKRVLTEFGKNRLYLMGAIASIIFAAQMFNFPINSGTSGHLIGGVFAAIILGPFAGTLALATVVTIQALIFADGGFFALGANIINMAFIGSFIGYYLFLALRKIKTPLYFSAWIAGWLSVILAAAAASMQIAFSGTIELNRILPAMIKAHLIIGLAEGLMTISLLNFVKQTLKIKLETEE